MLKEERIINTGCRSVVSMPKQPHNVCIADLKLLSHLQTFFRFHNLNIALALPHLAGWMDRADFLKKVITRVSKDGKWQKHSEELET
ncbi:MAG: hypothetical protein V1837_02035 [Candidatus Woesearchaeota archaeon]